MRQVGMWTLLILVGVALNTALDSSNVSAQVTGGPKLGFVDTQVIFREATLIKQKREELDKATQKVEEELKKKLSDWRSRQKELEAQKEILQLDVYEQRKAGLEKEFIDLRASKRKRETELTELYKETIRPVRARIDEVVRQIAKDEGFAFIFLREVYLYGETVPFLAYGAAEYDITQKVLGRLNQ